MRVLVVDDHPIVYGAVRAFLEEEGFEVVGHASNASTAAERLKDQTFDVVVMDIVLGRDSGTHLVKDLISHGTMAAVGFSAYDSLDNVSGFIEAGGLGFVSKRQPMEELASAIRAAYGGQSYVSPLDLLNKGRQRRRSANGGLSRREEAVVALIAAGLTSWQVARKLHISPNTVYTHRRRIFRKLAIHTVAELTRYAVEHGLAAEPVGPTLLSDSSPRSVPPPTATDQLF